MLIKICTVGHLFGFFGEREKKGKNRLEQWIGNWEQWDRSPLGGCVPFRTCSAVGDESARGDQSKEF